MNKVSIIVPVYNKQWCLARCVDSVLAQTQQDWTLILVDDGSKDNSLELCQAYAQQDPRIRVVAKENGGVSTARNAGLEVADGAYIVFLDADDWWEPDFLEVMVPLAEADRNIIPLCGYFRSSEEETPVLFDENCPVCMDETGIYQIYCRHYLNMLWNKVFVHDVIRKNVIRFPVGIHWGEDKLFILQYLAHIRGYQVIGRPLYHYDVSDGGLDSRFKTDELQLNAMLHKALFDFERALPGKTEEGHLELCREYVRVQLQGALRQVKVSRRLKYARWLKNDTLLRRCMKKLQARGECSGWLCMCQKRSVLLLLLSYGIQQKFSR